MIQIVLRNISELKPDFRKTVLAFSLYHEYTDHLTIFLDPKGSYVEHELAEAIIIRILSEWNIEFNENTRKVTHYLALLSEKEIL